jgi:heat-inducible transcriptional repressor
LDHPTKETPSGLIQLNERTREIFRHIVESYLATGEPVGSRNLSRYLPMTLSPASVRNVMSDLEHLGLIYAPHTSAGRLPTQTGLRLFVDGLLEVGNLTEDDMISGLSHCAGLVISEKRDGHLKHIEFVPLEPGKALVVLVGDDQSVENRVISIPRDLPPSALVEASNYLNAHIRGLSLAEARSNIERQLATAKAELDALTKKVIEAGLATWSGSADERKSLIVRGQGNLLKDLTAIDDLERIRQLFDDLEAKRELVQLLGLAEKGDGVHIFIGSENQLFSLSGSSLIVSPFRDSSRKIVGVLGVIGPTRLNYARIIPMVDYTARLISRALT